MAVRPSIPPVRGTKLPERRVGRPPVRQGASSPVARARGDRAVRVQGDSRKLGEVLAERIEDEIISSGLPIGTVLGSEPELIERYGVSRAVFREAIRIVDHHGVAKMRRGPGGGLVVAKPDIDAVVRAVALQLEFSHIALDQVYEARKALELKCVELAAERSDAEGRRRLEELLGAEEERIRATRQKRRPRGDLPSHDFHSLVAELTGNPAMQLFVQMIILVLGGQAQPAHSLESVAREVHRAHLRIAEAVIAGDVETAQRRMSRHLESVMSYMSTGAAGEGSSPRVGSQSGRAGLRSTISC